MNWLPVEMAAAFAAGLVTNAVLLRFKWRRVRRQEQFVAELTRRLKEMEE